MNRTRIPVDARIAGQDAVRAARAERRRRALTVFLDAPDPVSVENYFRDLAMLDGEADPGIPEQIA
jgi:hypothetical protein